MFENIGSFLNSYNYGLMPDLHNGEERIGLTMSEDGQQNIKLQVQRCCAVTRGGYYIDFADGDPSQSNDAVTPMIQLSLPFQGLKDKAACFYVLIVVDPSRCIPGVNVNTSEYSSFIACPAAALSLVLLPEQEIVKHETSYAQLTIGRIQIEGEKVLLDENYIPPCVSLSSHTYLLEVRTVLENFFLEIEANAIRILQKILRKSQTNELSAIAQKLCENISIFTAIHIAEIKSLVLHEPPVTLINKVVSLARIFKNTLDYHIAIGKDEFINYCAEWCNIPQSKLEDCIAALSNHQYDHRDINSSLEKVAVFVKLISSLFSNLAKIEFIGKRKDAAIFVTEQAPGATAQKRRRFLAGSDNESSGEKELKISASGCKVNNESEPVFLGASAPGSAAPGTEFTARFAAYIKSLEQEVQAKILNMSPGTKTHLGVQECRWQKGTNVKVQLYGNHFLAEPPEQEFSWSGAFNIINFDVKISSETPPITTVLKFDVFIAGFLIARLRFDLEIAAVVKESIQKTIKVSPIATAFASYASQDRERVLDRVSEIRRAGIDVFLDCLSMRPGEEWKLTLEKEIRNRESFLLFWSSNARRSEMVTWEWRTALAYKGIGGIEPHPLCPVSEAEPPEELKELHFGDLYMLVRDAGGKNKPGKQEETDKEGKKRRNFFGY